MNIHENIKIDKNSDKPLYIQIYDSIKKLILDNKLKAHTKLPSIRELSNVLKVNNITVVNSYKLLEQNDFIYKKVGSGTFVKEIILNHRIKNNKVNNDICYGNTISNNLYDFSNTSPSSNLFPINDFKQAINEVLDRDRGNAFSFIDSQGYYPLRQSIRDYLLSNKINTSEEKIIIVSGAQQGIDIISKTLIEFGDNVITEVPTYSGAILAFKSRAARTIEVPINNDGIDLRILEAKIKSSFPKFIYVMPNFQNPTGISYSYDKKIKLLELAKKYNTYIIEDDYLSDLKFNNNDNPTLKSMDKSDRVIYIKSFSKIFMPGLRLGFIVMPESLIENVLKIKYTTDITTSSLIQRAFDLYLRKGIWQKHISIMESVYKRRFKIMIESLRKYLPSRVKFNIPKGGLYFFISLPKEFSSNYLYRYCLERNVIISPGRSFFNNSTDTIFFRLSIANIEATEIVDGIKRLSLILNDFLNDESNKRYLLD